MAHLSTPGGCTGNLHTEHLQERNGNFTGGILYRPSLLILLVMCALLWVVDISVMILVVIDVGVLVVKLV